MTIGENIRLKREALGITQQKLACKLFVSRQTVCRWENGNRTPDLVMLQKIAEALHMPVDDLMPLGETVFLKKQKQHDQTEEVYAGFDCGGSNTRCMLVSKYGRVLGRGNAGPSNFFFCEKSAASKAVQESIRKAFEDAKLPMCELAGVFVASAAVEVFDGLSQESFFGEATGCKNVICDSDIFPVWYGATRFEPAIVMIGGTGSVAYYLEQNRYIKAGGWGALYGDDGSGYHIGISALRQVTKMMDGRLPMDERFCRGVLTHFEVDFSAPRRLIYVINHHTSTKLMAKVTECVLQLGNEGNATALELIEDSAEELACLVATLAAQTEGPVPLVLSGGLLQNDTLIRQKLVKKVSKLDKIRKISTPACEAVRSAAAIALCNNGYGQAAEQLLKGNE